MATKNHYLSISNKEGAFGIIAPNDQYNNLNLNQNKQCLSKNNLSSSKCLATNENRKSGDGSMATSFSKNKKRTAALTKLLDTDNSQKTREGCFRDKLIKDLPSDFWDQVHEKRKENRRKEFGYREKGQNNSTLSLHITAYENSIENISGNSINGNENAVIKKNKEERGLIKKCKNATGFFSDSVVESIFELPRQQERDKLNNPEVMQFKTSQRLFNPNQVPSSASETMDVAIKFDEAKNATKWLNALKANDVKTIRSLKDEMRNSEPLRFDSGKLHITHIITDLLEALTKYCSNEKLSEKLAEIVVSNIFRFAEMYNAFFCWLELKPTAFDNPKTQTENLWRLLLAVPLPKEHLYPLLESEFYSSFDMSEKRRSVLYEKAWLKYLYRGIPQNMVVPVLRKLTNDAMDCFTDSELVGDFLTIFAEKKDTNYGIFALKGIAKLMFEKNFSYPNFYECLYSKFSAIVTFPSFEAVEFLGDFDMYMSSSHVPAYIVAAFAKRVSRTCLVAHAELLELLLQTLRNMFINHQVVKQMLHREEIENLEKDPYIEDAPFKECHAIESSLWEVAAIFRHWSHDVTKRVEFAESKLKVTFNPDLRPTTSEEIFEHSFAKGAKKLENCAVQDPRLIKDKNWLSL